METVLFVSPDLFNHRYKVELDKALNIFKSTLGPEDTVIKGFDTIGSLYNIVSYNYYQSLDPDYYRFRTQGKKWYIVFEDQDEFDLAMQCLIPMESYKWTWKVDNSITDPGYEVTSKGDVRFSPFYMIFPDGESLELKYHLDAKGYRGKYSTVSECKGLVPINTDTFNESIYNLYKSYLMINKGLLFELAVIGLEYSFTDMFDKFGGQNKVYAEILNNYYNL